MTLPISPELMEKLQKDWHQYLMKRRQTLIMELGDIEDILGMERSIVPRRKRKNDRKDDAH